MKTRVLVAEDDINIREGLADILEGEGYEVFQARDGGMALDIFRDESVHLVILDVMMPVKSGYDVCREIRAHDNCLPIIMLTAKGEEVDKVVGLELGADDYITKPFGIHELMARIRAVMRRSGPLQKLPGDEGDSSDHKSAFRFGPFDVDPKTYTLKGRDRTQDISRREMALLDIFAAHPGEVLEREFLLNRVWGLEYTGTTRTLDQHIALLRKKVEERPAEPVLITTVHGIGYRFTP